MRPSDFIARLLTERRALVWGGVAALTIACIAILITRIELDSDVLNMLPGNFRSVEGLKIYNRDFEQTRELTFALRCQPADADRLEEFASQFAEHLRQQPWCARVLAGSPMETPDGLRDLQLIAVPLLLNLEPPEFEKALSILQPAKIRERLRRLHQQIEAGSPRPQFELEFDPLGVIGPALKPFAQSNAIEEDQPLTSPDRTMRIFLVVTNQQSIGAFECQELMGKVNTFRAHAQDGWDGGPLQILVTGRSAYVAEISLSMRHDVTATLLGSVLLVGSIFFVGFHRWLPLLGMGFALLLSCLVALALGLLIFGRLNMVTVGFCAILVGLGVDFAILIFGRYQQARIDGETHRGGIATAVSKLGRAVFFGALTTAVGFLALVLSGSPGFTQLGVLIAIGILFAGLFMCTILFLFIRQYQPPIRHDWLFAIVKKYVSWSVHRPAPVLIVSSAIFLLLTAFGFSPNPPLPFDASTRSLEPKNSNASRALAAIMHKMPVRWEPVLAIVHARDAQELHDDWQKISAHWGELQRAGRIKNYSTPAALSVSPMTMQQNRGRLRAIDLDATRRALEETLDTEGFSRDSFAPAFALLDQLKRFVDPTLPLPDWRSELPESSSWWFLIDRYFAQDPLLTTGFVTTNQPVATHEQREELSRDLPVADVPAILSGWSFTLADLLPWSHRQLLIVSGLMAIFDAVLLALLYRDWRLWIIQELTLLFAVGAMVASMKVFHLPLNLLNVLSFRLVLAIGVDYGIYVLLVWQKTRELEHDVAGVVKPVLLAGLTAVSGFGSLGLAKNPSLSGLGIICAIGIFWSLVATIFFTLPAAAAAEPKNWREDKIDPAKRGKIDNSMKKIFLGTVAFIFITSLVKADPLSPADVKSLLARIRQERAAAPQVQADFQEEKTMRLMNKPIVSSGKVSFQVPSKFRREVKGNSPSVTVSNGQQLWIYYPNFKSAEHYSLGKRSPLDSVIAAINTALSLENVEGSFHIAATKIDKGYDLELTPRAPSMKRMFQKLKVQINDDLLMQRTEMLQPNGDRIVTVYSNQTRAPLPGSTFEFTPPPGTDISTPLGR